MRDAFKILSIVILCAGILALGICSAEDVRKPTYYMTGWEHVGYQGQITEIGVKGDYIIVSGVKVLLVEDFMYEGKKYMTSIKDTKGKDVGAEALGVGKWVLVWGAGLQGDTIMAKDIKISSGRLSEKDQMQYFLSLPKWDYGVVKEFAKKK